MISGVWGSDLFRSDGRPFQSSSRQSQVTRQLEFEQITLAFHINPCTAAVKPSGKKHAAGRAEVVQTI